MRWGCCDRTAHHTMTGSAKTEAVMLRINVKRTNVNRTRYSIVGLGKLGASMAAAIASRGFDVIGVDVNAAVIEAVNAGRAPVAETGLADAIKINRARLSATAYHSEAIEQSDVS